MSVHLSAARNYENLYYILMSKTTGASHSVLEASLFCLWLELHTLPERDLGADGLEMIM